MSGSADTGETLRLFVALELPAGVRDSLSAWARSAVALQPGLVPVGPQSLHLTLCFLGARSAADVGAIAAACTLAAAPPDGAELPAVALSLGEPVWLPRRRPRVLAVGLRDEHGSLAPLQARVAAQLAKGGLWEHESRSFLGHVTVARVRARASAGGEAARGSAGARGPSDPRGLPGPAGARAELTPPEPLRFEATAVTLFRSHLGSGPARYEPLSRVILNGG